MASSPPFPQGWWCCELGGRVRGAWVPFCLSKTPSDCSLEAAAAACVLAAALGWPRLDYQVAKVWQAWQCWFLALHTHPHNLHQLQPQGVGHLEVGELHAKESAQAPCLVELHSMPRLGGGTSGHLPLESDLRESGMSMSHLPSIMGNPMEASLEAWLAPWWCSPGDLVPPSDTSLVGNQGSGIWLAPG